MTLKIFSNVFALALVGAVAGGSMLITSDAEAGKGKRDVIVQTYDFATPHEGFEGFDNTGGYCSYRKEPKRICFYTSSGKRKCKVKGWRLVQICQ
ncbi:MAG: hypothetical protein ACRBCJ_00715 [Hyphomicrobiaceae bacterium]